VIFCGRMWMSLSTRGTAISYRGGFRSIAFPLIGAGSGGGKAEKVLRWMVDELSKIEYSGDVRIVKYK
jgi:O-acetyl-ADP-ribose deacetylase (regulator of RNase III)